MDRESLTKAFLKHQPMLNEYVRALVRDPHDAEEVLQEVGVTILSRAEPPSAAEKFPAWARGVARNTALHLWRKKRRDRMIPDSRLLDAVDAAYEQADAVPEIWERRRRALRECLSELPKQSWNILKMKYFKGLTCTEIARSLRRNAPAVRMALVRLRHMLAECIERHLAGAG
jgi:RNA polymerase sigma-70 factor (ECF subfamily)